MTVLVVVSAVACLRLWLDTHFTKEDWRAAASYVQLTERTGNALMMHDNRPAFHGWISPA